MPPSDRAASRQPRELQPGATARPESAVSRDRPDEHEITSRGAPAAASGRTRPPEVERPRRPDRTRSSSAASPSCPGVLPRHSVDAPTQPRCVASHGLRFRNRLQGAACPPARELTERCLCLAAVAPLPAVIVWRALSPLVRRGSAPGGRWRACFVAEGVAATRSGPPDYQLAYSRRAASCRTTMRRRSVSIHLSSRSRCSALATASREEAGPGGQLVLRQGQRDQHAAFD